LKSKTPTYKIIAVIPAFNEAEKIKEVIDKTKKHVSEVIVVNDGSSDNTSELASQSNVSVIDIVTNKGAGFATRAGCDFAVKNGADIIVTIDADGQHCADDIPDVLNKLIIEEVDIVFGYRISDSKTPFVKKLGNKIIVFLSRLLFGVKLKDVLTGFHAFKSGAYPLLRWDSDRYCFGPEFVYRIHKNKLSFDEVKIKTIFFDNNDGMKISDGIKSILLLFMWRLRIPKRVIKYFNLK